MNLIASCCCPFPLMASVLIYNTYPTSTHALWYAVLNAVQSGHPLIYYRVRWLLQLLSWVHPLPLSNTSSMVYFQIQKLPPLTAALGSCPICLSSPRPCFGLYYALKAPLCNSTSQFDLHRGFMASCTVMLWWLCGHKSRDCVINVRDLAVHLL